MWSRHSPPSSCVDMHSVSPLSNWSFWFNTENNKNKTWKNSSVRNNVKSLEKKQNSAFFFPSKPPRVFNLITVMSSFFFCLVTKFSFPTKNNKQNPKNSNYLSFFTVLKKKNVDKTTGITGGTGISSEIELEKKICLMERYQNALEPGKTCSRRICCINIYWPQSCQKKKKSWVIFR